MEPLAKFLDACGDVWEAVVKRPKSFSTVGAALLLVGYGVGAWYYSGRVADAEQRVTLRDDELKKKDEAIIEIQKGLMQRNENTADVIASWGADSPRSCHATLSGASIAKYADTFSALLLCGFNRADVDKLTDPAITVSPAFSIEPVFVIGVPIGAVMEKTLAEFEDLARRRSGIVTWSVWYELVLIPKGIDRAAVRTLSDVARLGGKRVDSRNILATERVPK